MELERRPSESNLDYQRRIIYGKLVDKTLADSDYAELAELIYGQQYSSDVARRMMYGSKRTLDAIETDVKSTISDDAVLSDIKQATLDLQKERQRFFDQRREYNKLVSASGRIEHLEDRLVSAAENLNSTIGQVYPQDFTTGSIPLEFRGAEAVLVFSDWHYGMIADNAWNKFDTDICKRRIKDTVEAAMLRIKMNSCSVLHIVVLGDLIHGAIHTGVRVASEELVCDQLMSAAEILAQSIQALSSCVSETKVYMTYGNHARTVQDKKDNLHRDNMERIIPWWLKQRLRGCESITVVDDFENEFILFDVKGYGFCAVHGDLDSVKTSPRLLHTLFQRKYGINIDYILLGDKHHRESIEEFGVNCILCGALCGADEYANSKRLYSTPEQLLLIVRDGVGADGEYHLRCD